MKHNMKLKNGPYNCICYGDKDIEMRLYDAKRQLINVGDIITFTNIETMECFDARVINLHKYENFGELYKRFDKIRLGYGVDDEEKPEDMEEFYSKEEIDKYGVVGIEIEKI